MCLSFQFQKHLSLGRGGMILTDNEETKNTLKRMSYDGREPDTPWREQNINTVGYHYYMTPETAESGLRKLPAAINKKPRQWILSDWPDLKEMDVFKEKEVRLHLGCGKRELSGFIHIDIAKHPHIDYYHDIRTLPMFPNESVDLIYSCGTFEYFDRHEALDVLKEWVRVLKIGGVLRISVPDFESIAKVYLQNGKDLDAEGILGPLFGRIEIETSCGPKTIHHRTVYDFASIENLFNLCGLKNVRKYNWWDVLPQNYDDYSMAYMPHKDKNGIQMSLNVECIKGDNN